MSNLPEISDIDRDNIVHSGIQLLRALTRAYGADQAYQLYLRMEECLGEAAGLAFLAMLTGSDCEICMRWTKMHNKIQVIKAMRYSRSTVAGPNGQAVLPVTSVDNPTNLSLFDAKTIADTWATGGYHVWKCNSSEQANAFKKNILQTECDVEFL